MFALCYNPTDASVFLIITTEVSIQPSFHECGLHAAVDAALIGISSLGLTWSFAFKVGALSLPSPRSTSPLIAALMTTTLTTRAPSSYLFSPCRQVKRTYSHGTYRAGAMRQISLVGAVDEEVGNFFPEFLGMLEESPFLKVSPANPLIECPDERPRNARNANHVPSKMISEAICGAAANGTCAFSASPTSARFRGERCPA